MSFFMRIVVLMMKKHTKKLFKGNEFDVQKLRAASDLGNHYVYKGVDYECGRIGGVETITYTPKNCKSNNVIFYIHGGGMVSGDKFTTALYPSELAYKTGATAISCSYRLAPENTYPAAVDDVFSIYKELRSRENTGKICVVGDSGGAYLSLALAHNAKQENIPLPDALILNSIVADFSDTIKRKDVPTELMLTVEGLEIIRQTYAPGCDVSDPLLSVILGDFNGLPPMRVVYDSGELLAPDSKAVIKKAKQAGIYVEESCSNGCFHAFPVTGIGAPEIKQEIEQSTAFIKRCFAGNI